MNIAIGGSRSLPPGQAPRLLVRFLAALPADTVVLLRRGAKTASGRFELDTARLCAILGVGVEFCQPELPGGRKATFFRDIEMVSRSDLVIVFLQPDEVMSETSGTSHLIEKALDQHVPAYAYEVAADGAVRRVGEWDEKETWAELVPVP